MKTNTYILIILLLGSFEACSPKPIKVISVSDTVRFADGIRVFKGNKKAILIDTLEIIRELPNDFEVKYKGTTSSISYSDRVDNMVWVNDGIWNTYDSTGLLVEVNDWHNGINLSSKSYDSSGILTEHYYKDFVNDTSFYDDYIDGRLFKRGFYPPENKNKQTVIYYPKAPIGIDKAEFYFEANFLNKPIDIKTFQIFSQKKEPIHIKSIQCSSPYFKITDSNNNEITNQLLLHPLDTFLVKITYTPLPSSPTSEETLYIITEKETYEVFIKMKAHHIDLKNIKTVQKIELSKSKDVLLSLATLGTTTTLNIKKKGEKNNNYIFSKTDYSRKGIKVDLSILETIVYDLNITSCHQSGNIALKLVD